MIEPTDADDGTAGALEGVGAVDGSTDEAATPAAPDRAVIDRPRIGWWIGLAGVALLLLGSGWYQVWVGPPYRYADEQAHAGYVLELQRGHLPTIDTPIDQRHGGQALRDRLRIEPERRRDVWVANNPPLPYLIALVPASLTRALGWTGGPLLGMRLTNLACMVGAVVVAARLGANLAGGDRRVGLVAGGLFAAIPHLGFISGTGVTDGQAMLFTLLALDALVTICRVGASRRTVALLGLWCGLGAACRPMTAVLCGACALGAAGVIGIRKLRARDEGQASLVWSGLWLALPGLVLSGWWYVRNEHLYGDATGSHRLLEKFVRTPRPGPTQVIHYPSLWREILRTLYERRLENQLATDLAGWWPAFRTLTILVLVGAVALVAADQLRARRTGEAPATTALGWLGCYAAIVVVIALIAQHWSGGGGPHARYAFPALVVIMAAAALLLVRFATRWAGLAAVAVFLGIQARQVPLATTWVAAHHTAATRSTLTFSIGPAWLRLAGIPAMGLGALALAVGLALVEPTKVPAWLPFGLSEKLSRPAEAGAEAGGTDPPAPRP